MYIVYAIVSKKDRQIYVGFTANIERRVKEHNSGNTFSTKAFRPWQLLYTETASDRIEARKKEKYLKSGVGKEFLKIIRDSIPG
jgi:putative endonuclease